MDEQSVTTGVRAISQLSKHLAAMPENKESAAVVRQILDLAATYLTEYVRVLVAGQESFDALRALVVNPDPGFDALKADLMEAVANEMIKRKK